MYAYKFANLYGVYLIEIQYTIDYFRLLPYISIFSLFLSLFSIYTLYIEKPLMFAMVFV